MYRFRRSARIKAGKGGEAMRWARRVASFVNDKNPGISMLVFMEQFGDNSAIHWYFDAKDAAEVDAILTRLRSNPEYQSMLHDGVDIFIQGTSQDTLLRQI